MPAEHIDLLPPDRRRALRRDYLLRLATTTAVLALALTLAAAALLTPTYIFLSSALYAQEARLAQLTASLSSADEPALAARLASLEREGGALLALRQGPKVSALVREVLAISRPGIILTGFTYTAATSERSGTLAITGTAATRNVLRAYQLALADAPSVASADLPVSSYAKEQDIPFTIIATLAPLETP